MANVKQIVLFLILWSLVGCFDQKRLLNLKGYSEGQIKYVNENIDSSRLIKRANSQDVDIAFYEIFDDSVIVFVGHSKIWSGTIYKDQNPYSSTGWSGHDLTCTLNDSSAVVTIKLIRQRQYIKFRIFRDIPAYIIQRYNNLWYVRALRSSLMMR